MGRPWGGSSSGGGRVSGGRPWGGSGGGSSRGGVEGKRSELSGLIAEAQGRDESLWDKVSGFGEDVAAKGGNLVGKALEVLDLPRAAVVSTLQEQFDLYEGEGFSPSDWLRQVKEHRGFGDILEEEVPEGTPVLDNIWAKRWVGFGGDLLLDPLTYVGIGPVAKAVGAGGKALRLSTKDVARRLATEGMDEAAERVLAKGAGSLTRDEARRIGIKTGPSIGVGSRRLAMEGGSLTRAGAEVGGLVKRGVRKAPGAEAVARLFETVPGTAALRAGGQRLEALKLEDVVTRATARGAGVGQTLERDLDALAKKHRNVDPDTLARAVEGDAAARTATGAAWREIADWFESARLEAARVSGKEIPKFEDYLPHRLTEEFREKIGKAAGGRTAKRQSAEIMRAYRPGATFLGETLERGTIDEMHRIARERLGDKYVDLFRSNPWELARTYAREIEGVVRRELISKGVKTSGLERVGPTLAKVAKSEKKTARLSKAAAKHERRLADVERLEGDISRLTTALSTAPPTNEAAVTAARERLAAALDELDGVRSGPQGRLAELHTEHRAVTQEIERLRTHIYETAQRLGVPTTEVPIVVNGERVRAGDVLQRLFAQSEAIERQARRVGVADPKSVAESKVAKAQELVDQEEAKFGSAAAARRDLDAEVIANDARVTELEATVGGLTGRDAVLAQRELAHRNAASALVRRAAAESSADMRDIAHLESLVEISQAEAIRLRQKVMDAREVVSRIDAPAMRGAVDDMLRDGFKEFAKGRWADPRVADALMELEQHATPEKIGRLLKLHDQVMSRWKAWSLFTPGFHIRNYMGGMFNNSLAGMDPKMYFLFGSNMRKVMRAGFDTSVITDRRVRLAFDAMFENAVFTRGNVRDLADVIGDASRRGLFGKGRRAKALDPTSLDFIGLAKNRQLGEFVEKQLRGPLFLDRFLKTGGNLDESLATVAKYHFDYNALSPFERKWGRRAFPFYTWTRKNLPLQVEMMARTPGKYTRYLHAKRNIELGTEEDPLAPKYYSDLLAIRTPFKTSGKGFFGGEAGSTIYLTPDLPFRDMAETLNKDTLLGQLTPLVKTPLEFDRERSYFTNLPMDQRRKEAPATWLPILIAISPLQGKFGLPRVRRHKDGTWLMSERDAYKIEQSLPLLGRLRRMAPSEDRYQSRALTTYLSVLGGVGARTLDQGQVYGELSRRVEAVKKLLGEWEEVNEPLEGAA